MSVEKADPFDVESTPSPPHAPSPRPLAEEPLAVVDRLLADEASHLGDDQVWEFYAQIGDEVALEQGALTLEGRFTAHLGGELRLDLLASGSSGPLAVEGTVAHVGAGWLMLTSERSEFVINIDSVVSATTSSGDSLSTAVSESTRKASWTSLLRRCAQSNRWIVVHRRVGSAISGRVVLAARDHFDVAVTSSVNQMQVTTSTLPISNVIAIELR